MAWGGLQFSLKDNDKAHLGDWAWPLASALGHGQRVAFQVNGYFQTAASAARVPGEPTPARAHC